MATRAEDLTIVLTDMYVSYPQLSETVSELIFSLSNGIERILEFDESNSKTVATYLKFSRLIRSLEEDTLLVINEIRSHRQNRSTNKNSNTRIEWADRADQPNLIVAERVYSIDRGNNGPLKVVFSEKIVQKVLNSKDPLINASAIRSLNALTGTGGSSAAGIARLQLSKDVYEVRTKGKTGVFRLFGYMNGDTFHIVHWSKNSQHSTSSLHRAASSTLAIRTTRGH
jgi:hypothetical protein